VTLSCLKICESFFNVGGQTLVNNSLKVGLMIPTYNAGLEFEKVVKMIGKQKISFELRKIIIDSESEDETKKIAVDNGFETFDIDKELFTHGLVRQKAVNILKDCDFVFFMTQDVFLKAGALQSLFDFISRDPNILVAYGRQIVNENTENYFDAKDRTFNYPSRSLIKAKNDVNELGIKTVFSSDAFSIYNSKLLRKIGNFPSKIRFAEDMYIAARAIDAGYKIGYCADAMAIHSNRLNFYGLFRRYLSIGVFHAENTWIQKEYGSNESNGIKLVFAQIKEMINEGNIVKIPELILRTLIKYSGYTIGKIKGK